MCFALLVMKRVKTKFAIFGVMTAAVTGLVIWKTVIEPKDTRLKLYEILTEAKNSKYGNSAKTKLTSSWLSDLTHMNLNHLRPCERIQYHNTKAKLESYVAEGDRFQTTLQTVSRRYSTDLMTLEQLSQIGEAEFEKVLAELQTFKTQYDNAEGILSLDELAQQPQNFRSDSNEVEDIYKTEITRGEQSLASRFYDYDIPKGTARIIKKSHRYSAFASYDRRNNSLIAYFDDASYDVSITPFISVHEIFPGHHLNWKARTLGYRCPGESSKNSGWLLEGWATYAEFIADEEGFFDTAESKLAWLDYRLIRAMRIILDVKRMQAETTYSDLKDTWDQRMPERLKHRFDRELNRLAKSNHQHLSYVLGHQAILRTKTKLRLELGDRFDERAFHDAILRLNHQYPNVLYETTKIAMESPELRLDLDPVSDR